jgi:DNA (cytosine-5)-methyltransferase 1
MLNVTSRALDGIRYADVFAGIGAFRYAMDSFGAECVFTSEIDKACQDSYEKNHGDRPMGDITKVAIRDIPAFDVLCAGFPCQSFTIAGKQLGFRDQRGLLFFEVCRLAAAKAPLMLLLENVPNLLGHDDGRTFEVIRKNLDAIGYRLHFSVLNSGHFGVPQARERLYMVGLRKDLGIMRFVFPVPRMLDVVLEDVLLPAHMAAGLEIGTENRALRVSPFPTERALVPIRVGSVNSGSQGQRIYHPLGHAITLCSNGGGIGAKTGLYHVDGRIRRLLPRECARLSGFPESHALPKSSTTAYRQFGNTVVIDVLQHILGEVVNQNVLGLMRSSLAA